MTSEDTVEDPLMSVQFYMKSKVFHLVLQSIYCYFFLQKTLKYVFLPRYESLALLKDRYYFVTPEDTVEDLLMGVQFYTKSKSFFISCYSPSTVFILIAKDR